MRILLLCEDSGKDAHQTLKALVANMLRLIDKHHRPECVQFEPDEAALERTACAILRANRWKSRKHRRERVALVRELATRMIQEPAGMVLFHVDGDCVWSRRHTSENRAAFARDIADPMRKLIWQQKPDWDPSQIDHCMKRLVLLMPHYSIEAWTYQNTVKGKELCRTQYGGRDRNRFAAWEKNRALLDEVKQLKDTVCLGGKHNRELAASKFPYEEAHGAETSYAAAVEDLKQCDELRRALGAGVWTSET